MAHVIELSSGANPLTLENLFKTLRSASSPWLVQVQTGTAQLDTWQKFEGFYPLLQDIFIDSALPLEVRTLAIIKLKHGVDKFWRKTALSAVSKNDKARVRSRLIQSGINEANRQLSLHNAIVIAKVVRHDYPGDWPDAIDSLTQILRDASEAVDLNSMVTSRCLTILLHCVKELATARLMRSRVSLQAASPEIIRVVGRLYFQQVNDWASFIQKGGNDEGGAIEKIEISLRAVKTLRRLFIFGHEHPNRDDDIVQFWNLSRRHFGEFLSIVTQQGDEFNSDIRDLIERHLVQFAKLHLEMAQQHPYSFVLLPDSVSLVQAYWDLIQTYGSTLGVKSLSDGNKFASYADAEDGEKTLSEKLTLRGLQILRACIKLVFNPQQTFKYRQPEDKVERKQAEDLLKAELFTDQLVMHIMEVLVTKFFVLSEVDLRDWTQDWEEWEQKIDTRGDEYLFSVRPCGEKLFLDLMINFKSLLVDPLLKSFYEIATPENNNIILKDSIYTAVALAAPVLRDKLDFDAFLTSVVVEDIKRQIPGSNILRRSICIMLGEWVSVKISRQNRPLVCQIFDHFLKADDPLNDEVVRITAARQLKYAVDEIDFESADFVPFAPTSINNIMILVGQTEKTDLQMILVDTISVIVERMERLVLPFADNIMSILPRLWADSGEQHWMKQAILTLLTRIVTALQSDSLKYHEDCFPLITLAIEPHTDMQIFLIDEALDLWLAIIAQTPEPASAEILNLAQGLPQIYQLDESLLKALKLTEAYLLLSPGAVLSDRLKPGILHGIAMMQNRVRSEIGGQIIQILEYSIRFAGSLDPQAGARLFAEDLIRSDILLNLLDGLYTTWAFHNNPSSEGLGPKVEGIVETEYFNVLSRLVLAIGPNLFLELVQAANGSQNGGDASWLFVEWFSHFGNIGHPYNRKLHAMALTSLVGLGRPFLATHLQDLMTVWADIVTELREDAEERGGDSLVYPERFGEGNETTDSPEELRRKRFSWSDPVHKVNISVFIKAHLDQASASLGGRDSLIQVRPIDETVARSFNALNIW